MKRGLFITFEGIDGTGKTTQFHLLVNDLRSRGYTVCATREPGGTRVGEQVRRVLLKGAVQSPRRRGAANRGREAGLAPTPLAELALMYAARAQLVDEVIRPALARGHVVLSDRYNDSSLAYQGYGRRLGAQPVRALDRIICGETQPDLTLVLDFDPRRALRRAQRREKQGNSSRARFEAQGLKFHERVHQGYLALARREPRRVKLVRADRPVVEVRAEIRRLVDRLLGMRTKPRKAKEKSKIERRRSKAF